MKRILDKKIVANLTLAVMLIGGIVYSLGFGVSLYIANKEVTAQADKNINREIDYVNTYIDGQLQRIEDAGYSLASRNFGKTIRKEDGSATVNIDPRTFVRPTPEECYTIMEQFMEANPMICGIAIGFEPFVYPELQSKYGGFAPYVSRLSGKFERMNVADIGDFRKREWYREASATNHCYWSNPFHDSSQNHLVTCFSIPVHGYGGRLIGVLAIDVDTDTFRQKCKEIAPYPNSVVTLVDRNFRFIAHPDTSYISKAVEEIKHYRDFKADDSMKIKMEEGKSGNYYVNEGTSREALFYFAPITRTGWMIAIECPKTDVYGGLQRMKRDTTIIAILSILFMLVSFIWIFRRMQKITISKASIESELHVASAIQMGMIPKLYPAFPDRKELDVCGFIKPAKSVGGDLYDYFVRDEKLYFCIGDVSGKGIPASLFMTVILALFRNVSLHTGDPAELLTSMNATISRGNEHCMFCTMFVGILDLKTGHLRYCNGGHNAPIIRRVKEDGSIDVHYMDTTTNLAVGMFEGFSYNGEETTLSPDEALFMYTDGVTEAEDTDHNLFGEEATIQSLKAARLYNAKTSKDFIDHMFSAVEEHAGNAEQSDDITMLIVEYKGTHNSN